MPLEVNCILRPGQEIPYDLCAEALTSSNPPLSPNAKLEIANIRKQRSEALKWSDRIEIDKVFEALDRLPPIEGPSTRRLLTVMADSDFSSDDLESALKEMVSVSKSIPNRPDIDREGFAAITTTATMGNNSEEGKLRLNMQRAELQGAEIMAEMYSYLSLIEGESLRREVIQDCCRIIELRLHFDFSV